MTFKNDLIAIRNSVPDDHNFVLATWLRGLKYGNDWFQLIESEVYFAVYQRMIEAILKDPRVVVKVACLKEDPEVVLGYAVYSGNRLDWVFVKKAWRNIGIAKSLVPESITVVSHLTTAGKNILRNHKNVFFNPFSIT